MFIIIDNNIEKSLVLYIGHIEMYFIVERR